MNNRIEKFFKEENYQLIIESLQDFAETHKLVYFCLFFCFFFFLNKSFYSLSLWTILNLILEYFTISSKVG